jgi:mannose-6-phosphate isomerase-like protein (cupin superfamily)/GNAT superfamily N-acetyltransferase
MKTKIDSTEHFSWGIGNDGWHILKSNDLSVMLERMNPGTQEVIHCHPIAQQVFYILSGVADFEIEGKAEKLLANQFIHVPRKKLHKISNIQNEDLKFLVISEPFAQDERIEILNYNESLKEHIKILNVEWLEKYFIVEPIDYIQLGNPKQEILDKGGIIFYAKYRNEIVGTASLLKIDNEVYELGKMAVTEKVQGKGIGRVLMQQCLASANQNGIKRLILYSNSLLQSAIHLYRDFGFYDIVLEPGHYQRANIKMEKLL